jgi:hypothetical protein
MLQRGNTRAIVRYTRRKKAAAEIIARHYTRRNKRLSGCDDVPGDRLGPTRQQQ